MISPLAAEGFAPCLSLTDQLEHKDMGSELSQGQIEAVSLDWYRTSLLHPCLLPDVGIDDTQLKYSSVNSNYVLETYSNQLATSVPDYIEKLGSILGSLTFFPNAVGLGALVISMIIDIAIKSKGQTSKGENSYSMFQRIFGEEKASAVRDTMSEYLRRHRTFMNNEQRLIGELRRLEEQLSGHLSILKNSLQHDGQINSRGFNIWVNGAFFHIQMLIHEALLSCQTRRCASRHIHSIQVAIDLYLQDLNCYF